LFKQNTNKYWNIAALVVVLIFLFDFITKCIIIFDIDGFKRYSAIPKTLLEIGIVALLLKKKAIRYPILIYLLILVSIFVLNNILKINQFKWGDFLSNLYILNKYLYVFFFIMAYSTLEEKRRKNLLIQIKDIVILIGIVNGVFMILGLLTQWEILKSYPFSSRFGYNGFFVKTSEASYLYILLVITTYFDYLVKRTNGILCLYFIFIAFLLGTKAIWVFVGLVMLLHFFYNERRVVKKGFIIALTSTITIMLFSWTKFIELIINVFPYGSKMYQEHGIITVLLSTRDILLISAIDFLKINGTWLMYLFGGNNLRDIGVEFEFIDIFLFFGLLGLIVYALLIKRSFFSRSCNKHKALLFFSLMLVTFFAGNFFMSIISSIFAFVIFENMDYSERNLK
jgi:hypothetical protein